MEPIDNDELDNHELVSEPNDNGDDSSNGAGYGDDKQHGAAVTSAQRLSGVESTVADEASAADDSFEDAGATGEVDRVLGEDDEHREPPPRRRRERRPRDARADRAFDFLARVLDEMGMDVSVRRRRPRPESSPDEINLEIVGRDVGRVIGKKGQVLSALQYLVNRVTNRPGQQRRHVVLDAEGYRHRRETTLATMARRLGEQAVKEGKIITFEPMSPRDRRVVHLALAKFPNVVTKSDGEGDERRVRIIPVRR